MEIMEKKKINPYIVIIVILVVVVVGLVYNQWGKKFLPSGEESGKKTADTTTPLVDTRITGDDILIGSNNAPVTIIEYYSYFCGYCKLFHDETYPKIIENYISTGEARYVLRPYPPYELGTAVLCAKEQNKFLEYHNSLFENSANIEKVDDLKQLAGSIGLNEEQFSQCFDSQKYLTKAQTWYQQGDSDFAKAGVASDQRGTPAFFINNELIIGAQPYDKFVEIIERKLNE